MVRILVTVIVVLFITISYLLHQIEGVNLWVWYLGFGVMFALRGIRAYLIIKK